MAPWNSRELQRQQSEAGHGWRAWRTAELVGSTRVRDAQGLVPQRSGGEHQKLTIYFP